MTLLAIRAASDASIVRARREQRAADMAAMRGYRAATRHGVHPGHWSLTCARLEAAADWLAAQPMEGV